MVALSPSGEAAARRVAAALGAALHGREGRVSGDVTFPEAVEHVRTLFAAGVPIVGVCAAGVLIRAVAPLLADKRAEPPVVAVAEDGSCAVPLLGGHRGANVLARRVAEALAGVAAVTTAGDLALGVALDAPPEGWRLANPEDAGAAMAAALGGGLRVEGAGRTPDPVVPPGDTSDEGRAPRKGDARSVRDASGRDDPSGADTRGLGDAGDAFAVGLGDGLEHRGGVAPGAGWGGDRPTGRAGAVGGGGAGPSASAAAAGDGMVAESVEPLGGRIPFVVSTRPDGAVALVGTEAPATGGPARLVYHPRRHVLGLGCARGADPGALWALVERVLGEAGVAPGAVAAVATIALKADEPAIVEAARRLDAPLRLFDAGALEAETPRLANPSARVFAEVGAHGVAEAAALACAGSEAVLVVDKRKTAEATCALARAPAPIAAPAGRPRGRLTVVGIGPGRADWRTPEASRAVASADELVGYGLYLDLLGPLAAGKPVASFPLGGEEARCRHALERAGEGLDVALVCSGDAGVYAMASLVFETIDRGAVCDAARRAEVVVVPGVSAMQAAAARAGAPLGHDFCAISLSDLLTPRADILRRVRAAAEGDFAVAFYNPVSRRRRTLLADARDVLLAHRPAGTPVVLAASLGRAAEAVRHVRLADLRVDDVDMLTLVIVGSSGTRRVGPWCYTPRGYAAKGRLGAAPASGPGGDAGRAAEGGVLPLTAGGRRGPDDRAGRLGGRGRDAAPMAQADVAAGRDVRTVEGPSADSAERHGGPGGAGASGRRSDAGVGALRLGGTSGVAGAPAMRRCAQVDRSAAGGSQTPGDAPGDALPGGLAR